MFRVSKLESYGLLDIVKMHIKVRAWKKYNSKQDSELFFQPWWVNWYLTMFPSWALDNKQQRVVNPQEKWNMQVKPHVYVGFLPGGALWHHSVEVEHKRSVTVLLSWGGTDQSLKLLRWLWSRAHEERLLSRGRHQRSVRRSPSGVWSEAGLSMHRAKFSKI